MARHIHDKAEGGQTFETVKGVYIELRMQMHCSKCHKPMGSRLISKVQSPLRARLGRKAGKMVWFKDNKKNGK